MAWLGSFNPYVIYITYFFIYNISVNNMNKIGIILYSRINKVFKSIIYSLLQIEIGFLVYLTNQTKYC